MGFLEQCTHDQVQKLYEEFGATEETVERDIQCLKEWIEKQPHLPNVKDERVMRMIFIRSKASLEKAKHSIETYYILKARYLDFFIRADPTAEQFKRYLDTFTRFPLPKLLPDLSRIYIMYEAPSKENESTNNSEEFFTFAVTSAIISASMSGAQKGVIFIIDAKNTNFARTSFILPTFQKLISFTRLLSRTEKVYIINSSVLLEPILMLGRQISKKVYDKRLVVWKKDEKNLSEVIPKEYLPNEYGGTLGSRDELRDLYFNETQAWKDWLIEENKIYADLSKLPEDRKEMTEIGQFGIEGTFRKLELE